MSTAASSRLAVIDAELRALTPRESPKEAGWRAGWLELARQHPHCHRARRAFWYRGFDDGKAARLRLEEIRATKAQRGELQPQTYPPQVPGPLLERLPGK